MDVRRTGSVTVTSPSSLVGAGGRGERKASGRPGLGPGETVFRSLTAAAAAAVLGLVVLLAVQMVIHSWPTLVRDRWAFLTGTVWDPVFAEFGALPFIWGTVASSFLALLLAVPVSLGVAVFLTEIANGPVRRALGFLVEILASVPSVVYGLWGVFVLVPLVREIQPELGSALGFLPLFQGPPLGFGMLAAGLVLAIMVLPVLVSLIREALNSVPDHQREASLALGSTRWETIRHAVLPCNKSGIVAAVALGLGRAVGETMAVTMVIGNQPIISASLFMPAQTMASLIANEFAEASDELYLSALIEMGLVLFGLTLLLNAGAKLLVIRMGHGGGRRR